MRDLHVHTEFSCYSGVRIEDYILKAIDCCINEICFTDHVDFNIYEDTLCKFMFS